MVQEHSPRTVVWASSNPPGVERCSVSRGPSGWVLEGHLVRHFKGGTAAISYRVDADPSWKTRGAHVEQYLGGDRRSVDLKAGRSGWYVQGNLVDGLKGCLDVDLGASPVTNTLPIKRARPKIGSRLDLTAAWVRFPDLVVAPLTQSYERVGERLFVYRSASGFSSEIEMDDFGLVRRYGEYWRALSR